ncbi:Helix-turn-helix domain-containing protein [Rhodococcus triatomae]|uniref:Helix-turn-helix domain-containing protein n=1 Tax=Rhodococcus triatomae TaxID=300028 RepID=A0A1G8RN80_9NOCA|nr:helix-turn-helix transcriptional regulator [Rhodococcus triatomae]SDJ18441.1 Helix-turn-helix domain-containing protein [Rhodococcus triatomae]
MDSEDRDAAGAGDIAAVVSSAAHDIGGFIRAQRESAQVSLRQLAQLAGVSNPYLSQIERGLRKPSAEVLAQIAKGLRVSSEVLYVQAGYLEQRAHSPVRDALLADTFVTERQKQVLLEIYESFRRENDSDEPRATDGAVVVSPSARAGEPVRDTGPEGNSPTREVSTSPTLEEENTDD